MSNAIRDRLVQLGQRELDTPKSIYAFTSNADANALVNDLEHYPHAFLIACIADRQIPAERAWLLPALLRERLGSFEFSKLRTCSEKRLQRILAARPQLHRFPNDIGSSICAALAIIGHTYNGNTANIWAGKPSSAEAVYRFLQFPGIGIKIATMTVNILTRHLKVPFDDYYSIDISPDAHVRRVFGRLGLTRADAPNDELIYRARALSPRFPGLLDYPTWDIGKKWCKNSNPICGQCVMHDICPFALSGGLSFGA